MKRRNFHSHTYLCKHGSGTPSDYCLAAREQGVCTVGITDHTPHRGDAFWLDVRMKEEEFPQYVREIAEARNAFPDIEVLGGLECEYVPEEESWYREVLLGPSGVQYLIGGFHHYLMNGEWMNSFTQVIDAETIRAYTDFTIRGMATGLFRFLAHPDLFGTRHQGWNADDTAAVRDICQAAVDLHIPLEINANGLRKRPVLDGDILRCQYPLPHFWDIAAEYPVEVLCNSDAHSPNVLWGTNEDALAFAQHYHLNVINETFTI